MRWNPGEHPVYVAFAVASGWIMSAIIAVAALFGGCQ